jgi:hypothetical protein
MSEALLQFVSVVPKDTPLGRHLAALTPSDLAMLRSDFERRFAIEIEIDDDHDEAGVHDALWLDFPRYEVTFLVLRLTLLHQFEELAFEIDTPTPEPEN